jgi:hypothetical protein
MSSLLAGLIFIVIEGNIDTTILGFTKLRHLGGCKMCADGTRSIAKAGSSTNASTINQILLGFNKRFVVEIRCAADQAFPAPMRASGGRRSECGANYCNVFFYGQQFGLTSPADQQMFFQGHAFQAGQSSHGIPFQNIIRIVQFQAKVHGQEPLRVAKLGRQI